MDNSYVPCDSCGGQGARFLFHKNEYDLVKCNHCDLIYVGSPPNKEVLEKMYSFASGYHDSLTKPGQRQDRFRSRAQEQFDQVKSLCKPGRLLDVGCSVGFFLAFAKRAGWDVSGVEFSKDSADFAREQLGNVILDGAIEDANFPAEEFDLVTMWDVIEHVSSPASALAKAAHLLKKNGMLVISTPNIDGIFPKASLPFASVLKHWPHPEPPYHLYQFSAKTLSRMLEKFGFQVDAVKYESIPLGYSFGDFRALLKSPFRLAYAALFAPLVKIGPWVGAGDSMVVFARKV